MACKIEGIWETLAVLEKTEGAQSRMEEQGATCPGRERWARQCCPSLMQSPSRALVPQAGHGHTQLQSALGSSCRGREQINCNKQLSDLLHTETN